MKGTTHRAIGIAATSIFLKTQAYSMEIISPYIVIKISAAYLGALLCDIDTMNSTISNLLIKNSFGKAPDFLKKNLLILISILIAISGIVYGQIPLIFTGIILALLIFSPHRGYSHSILACGICYGAAKYTCNYYNITDFSFYLLLGMVSHIAADIFTNHGVAALFPFKRKIRFPVTITTGSSIEYIITLIAGSIFIVNLGLGVEVYKLITKIQK